MMTEKHRIRTDPCMISFWLIGSLLVLLIILPQQP